MGLTLILAECGLELIPRKLRSHPVVRKQLNVKNYQSQLLDTALHHSEMKSLVDKEKRGRPDILHACLLNALGTPLNKSGNLTLYIHTIKNKIFRFNPDIRITRNYNRFKGLMAKLLIDGKITFEDSDLITSFEGSLAQLIDSIGNSEIMLFSSKGKLLDAPHSLFTGPLSKNHLVIIGGFQKNTFSNEILALSDDKISISKYSLDAWIVVSKVIDYYEISYDIQ